MKSFWKLTITQMKLFAREPVAFFFTLVFPVLVLLLFGAIWGNDPGYAGTYGYIDFQTPGLVAMTIGTVALMSIPIATATAREQKVLRRYQATPLQPLTYVAAEVVVYFLLALSGMVLLVIVAKVVFDLQFAGSWPAIALAFTYSTLAFVAVGYVIGGLSPTSRIAQVLGQVIYFPMLFLSGATIPLQIMPEGVQQVSQWLPLTHVVALLQDLWLGGEWNTTALWVMAGLLIGGIILSSRTFRWE